MIETSQKNDHDPTVTSTVQVARKPFKHRTSAFAATGGEAPAHPQERGHQPLEASRKTMVWMWQKHRSKWWMLTVTCHFLDVKNGIRNCPIFHRKVTASHECEKKAAFVSSQARHRIIKSAKFGTLFSSMFFRTSSSFTTWAQNVLFLGYFQGILETHFQGIPCANQNLGNRRSQWWMSNCVWFPEGNPQKKNFVHGKISGYPPWSICMTAPLNPTRHPTAGPYPLLKPSSSPSSLWCVCVNHDISHTMCYIPCEYHTKLSIPHLTGIIVLWSNNVKNPHVWWWKTNYLVVKHPTVYRHNLPGSELLMPVMNLPHSSCLKLQPKSGHTSHLWHLVIISMTTMPQIFTHASIELKPPNPIKFTQ